MVISLIVDIVGLVALALLVLLILGLWATPD